MTVRNDVAPGILERLRRVCLALPEVVEEEAWVGTRWRVRARTFAHVLLVDDGWPPAYARAAGTDGPVHVLTFRAAGSELAALRGGELPFFATPWRADEIGALLGAETDWEEIAELLTESFRIRAPRALRAVLRDASGTADESE